MRKLYLFTGIYCLALWPALLSAQTGAGSNNDVATQKTTGLFYNNINNDAALYNGSEYIMYDPHIKGTPYFMDADTLTGNIMYSGTLYGNVPMLYEITTGNI